MTDVLDDAMADIVAKSFPGIADTVRKLKALGAEKSAVVERVTKGAGGSAIVRSCVMTLVDKIWRESP